MDAVVFNSSREGQAFSHKEVEESERLLLDYKKLKKVALCEADVVPVVAQDADTGEVLVIAYANELALQTTFLEGKATFWSTSRNELWIKGKTSGDYMEIVDVRVNCEQNSLLYLVRPLGKGTCHTRDKSNQARSGCYYRSIRKDGTLCVLDGKE